MTRRIPDVDFLAAIAPFNFRRFNFTLSGIDGRPAVDCRPEIALVTSLSCRSSFGRRPRLAYSLKKSLLCRCSFAADNERQRHSECQSTELNRTFLRIDSIYRRYPRNSREFAPNKGESSTRIRARINAVTQRLADETQNAVNGRQSAFSRKREKKK